MLNPLVAAGRVSAPCLKVVFGMTSARSRSTVSLGNSHILGSRCEIYSGAMSRSGQKDAVNTSSSDHRQLINSKVSVTTHNLQLV